jgi:hypothetical protein
MGKREVMKRCAGALTAALCVWALASPARAADFTFEGDTVSGSLSINHATPFDVVIVEQMGSGVVAGPGVDLTGQLSFGDPTGRTTDRALWQIDVDIVADTLAVNVHQLTDPPILGTGLGATDLAELTISDLDFLGDVGGGVIRNVVVTNHPGFQLSSLGKRLTFTDHSLTLTFDTLEDASWVLQAQSSAPEPAAGALAAVVIALLAATRSRPRARS